MEICTKFHGNVQDVSWKYARPFIVMYNAVYGRIKTGHGRMYLRPVMVIYK